MYLPTYLSQRMIQSQISAVPRNPNPVKAQMSVTEGARSFLGWVLLTSHRL